MEFSKRLDTIFGSIYWNDIRLLTKHTNTITREREQILKDIYELADSFIFYAKARENAEIMSEPWEEI